METDDLRQNSLILYKNQPGRITTTGKKLFIELADGRSVSVRPKDVQLLHPGPITSLGSLQPRSGDVQTAWELLADGATTLPELAELAFGDYTPQTAWAAWQLVADGLYFSGEPEAIVAHTAVQVAEITASRVAKAAAEAAWDAFVQRVSAGTYAAADHGYLQEVVALAQGQRENSRVLRALGQAESPQHAHALLLRMGYWDSAVNPYPQRLGAVLTAPPDHLPELPAEERRDLTHLTALAIDDDDNQDPDDAISWDGERLWVHIADVAALVTPDSPADLAARERGANLYLPEGTIPMLPPSATPRLGLGLADVSPALSFGLVLNEQDEVTDVQIVPSWVRVTRTTYNLVEAALDEDELLAQLYALAARYEARRRTNGSVEIALPEVKVRVEEGMVVIRPLPDLRSRTLVREAMLMTGEAVARLAQQQQILLPFTVQDGPDVEERHPQRPSEAFALRKKLKRSQQSSTPGLHAGLGMPLYAQATSPLRRYLDLVVHQQLRAYLRGLPLLDEQALMERIGAMEAITGSIRTAERLSNQHWKLVYLQQHPDWQGDGVVLDVRGKRSVVLLPELDLETELFLTHEAPLDGVVRLQVMGVNLPELEAHFRVVREA
jgi:exoribonuclease-2